jgi:nicotinamide riboside kinase
MEASDDGAVAASAALGRYNFGDDLEDVLMEAVDLNDHSSWRLLLPTARAQLARRVVVLGAGRSGRTTLARALARRFNTVCVPRYGERYWEGRRYSRGAAGSDAWDSEEFVAVAKGQLNLEEDLAMRALKVVVCDTDVHSVMVWEKCYRGSWSAELERLADLCTYDLFILTKPDFADASDELANVGEGEGEAGQKRAALSDGAGPARAERHAELKALLRARECNYIVVSGATEARVEAAAEAIAPLLVFPDRYERFDDDDVASVVSDYRQDWADPAAASALAAAAAAPGGAEKWAWLHPEKKKKKKIFLTDDEAKREAKRKNLERVRARRLRLERKGHAGVSRRGSALDAIPDPSAQRRKGRRK